MHRDVMTEALRLVAEELAAVDRPNLRELLAAAQEIAEARGLYAARDLYDATTPDDGVPRMAMGLESSADTALLSSSDLC